MYSSSTKWPKIMLGYTAEEVLGKMNIRSVYPPWVAKEVMLKLRSNDFGGVGKLTLLSAFIPAKGRGN